MQDYANIALAVFLSLQLLLAFTAYVGALVDRSRLSNDQLQLHAVGTSINAGESPDDALSKFSPQMARLWNLGSLHLPLVPASEIMLLGESTLAPSIGLLRRRCASLPMIALVGTFLGIGLALGLTAQAQRELSTLLQSQTNGVAVSAGQADQLSAEEFAVQTRSALSTQLSASMNGLGTYVEGQRVSLSGMALAVSSTILGVLLSLFLGRVRSGMESSRRELLLALLDMLIYFAQHDELQDDAPTRATLIEAAQELVNEVHLVRDEMRQVEAKTSTAVHDVQALVERIEPVARETQTATRMLNSNVDELNSAFQGSALVLTEATDKLQRVGLETSSVTTVIQGTAEHMSAQLSSTERVLTEVQQRIADMLENWNSSLVEQSRSSALQGRVQSLESEIRELRASTEGALMVRPTTRLGRFLSRLLQLEVG